MKSGLTFLLFILLPLSGCAQSVPDWLDGKVLYEASCVRCHGKDGTSGKFGAKNLRISTRSEEELSTIISNGKGLMPSWRRKLSAEQIMALIAYIKKLRK